MAEAGLRVVQVTPLSVDHSTLVIAAPLSDPATNDTESPPSVEAMPATTGASGAPAGRPTAPVLAGPAPRTFTARSLTV